MHKHVAGFLKTSLIASLAIGLGACKILISVPENIPGAVITHSANYFCLRDDSGEIDEDSICEADVVDIHFDETFVPVAAVGYVFSGWKKGNRFLCGGSRRPCALSTAGFEGNDVLLAFLSDDQQEFYLEPVFTPGDEALTGDYAGTWTNVTFDTTGAISLSIVDNGDDTLDIILDLDGNVFGQGDPEPVTIVAQQLPSGRITASGEIEIAGTPTGYSFELDEDRVLEFSIPNMPISGFRTFEALGTINGGTGYIEYRITFIASAPALGTAAVYKI